MAGRRKAAFFTLINSAAKKPKYPTSMPKHFLDAKMCAVKFGFGKRGLEKVCGLKYLRKRFPTPETAPIWKNSQMAHKKRIRQANSAFR